MSIASLLWTFWNSLYKTPTQPIEQPIEEIPTIRWGSLEDINDLVIIEKNSGQEDIWTRGEFQEVFSRKRFRTIVTEYCGQLIGYLAFETDGSANVLWSIAVLPEFRRRGVGSAMVSCLKGLSGKRGRDTIFSTSRAMNLDYQLFLKAQGFVCIETREDHYECPPDEGRLFEWNA